MCIKSRLQERHRVRNLNFISNYGVSNLDKSLLGLFICKALVLKWVVDEITYRFYNLWLFDVEIKFGVMQRCQSLNCGNN